MLQNQYRRSYFCVLLIIEIISLESKVLARVTRNNSVCEGYSQQCMADATQVNLELCNSHLQALFRAIERGDVVAVYRIEHRLTPEEECVACAYALKARGVVREVLDTFLQKEGFMVAVPRRFSVLGELKFWFIRLGLLVGLLVLSIGGGTSFKTWVLEAKQATFLGGFGVGGAVLFATAAFIFIENHFLEE